MAAAVEENKQRWITYMKSVEVAAGRDEPTQQELEAAQNYLTTTGIGDNPTAATGSQVTDIDETPSERSGSRPPSSVRAACASLCLLRILTP